MQVRSRVGVDAQRITKNQTFRIKQKRNVVRHFYRCSGSPPFNFWSVCTQLILLTVTGDSRQVFCVIGWHEGLSMTVCPYLLNWVWKSFCSKFPCSLFFAEQLCRADADCIKTSDDERKGTIIPFITMATSVLMAYFAIKAMFDKLVMKC